MSTHRASIEDVQQSAQRKEITDLTSMDRSIPRPDSEDC
jgi:hypothetical protein